jgi:hypothetical protein
MPAGKHIRTPEMNANMSKAKTGTRICNCICQAPFECEVCSDQIFINGHQNIGRPNSNKYGRGKGGFREDLGIYVRSTWEANWSRSLNYEGIPWEYECKRFILERADKSKYTYCPDFHILGTAIWYEVKGYMNEKSKKQIKLFKEQYPNETLIVIGKEEYKRMAETYKDLIPNWES